MVHNDAVQDEDMSMDEILASIRRYVTGDGDQHNTPSNTISQPPSNKQGKIVHLTAEDEWPSSPAKEIPPSDADHLISEEVRSSAQKSFQKMEQLRDLKNTVRASSGGRTMDDFIVELLRPLLKQWMDKNLPALVERIVEREIQNTLNTSDRF